MANSRPITSLNRKPADEAVEWAFRLGSKVNECCILAVNLDVLECTFLYEIIRGPRYCD